ncbi:hypothetical protein HPB47_016147 [Ixodes persulcatus]|uniref:Uncharacterized protein n=1 Tax=Ixodes persulcatus TaxID=34615 RepID=A0AC60QRN0_IXOPE|nr:hypothetical protein HPB47_016147 [Ixodes persulcatus]
MAEKATPEDKERCVADGVDVLRRLPGQSMKGWNNMHIIDYFKDNDLKLLTSDKEGGFVVVTRDMFAERSQQAILKNFKKTVQQMVRLCWTLTPSWFPIVRRISSCHHVLPGPGVL